MKKVIFLYNLYIFVTVQYDCLLNTVFASDPSNSVVARVMQKVLSLIGFFSFIPGIF